MNARLHNIMTWLITASVVYLEALTVFVINMLLGVKDTTPLTTAFIIILVTDLINRRIAENRYL